MLHTQPLPQSGQAIGLFPCHPPFRRLPGLKLPICGENRLHSRNPAWYTCTTCQLSYLPALTGRLAPRVIMSRRSSTVDPVVLSADEKRLLQQLHRNESGHFLVHFLSSQGYLGLMALNVWAYHAGLWPVLVVSWLIGANLGHSKLVSFHEAAHATLNPRRWLNELQGIVVGTVALLPLSTYRHLHWAHHSYISQPRDLEFWPFVDTRTPRWFRIISAALELTIGFFYTPMLLLGALFVGPKIPRVVLRRIVLEYAFCALVWGGVLAVVAYYGWWMELLVGYLVPAMLAANLQTLNKYTEHMGLLGDSILTSTRTVVDERLPGWLMSEAMLHIDYHGTHHRYAKVPYYALPDATPLVYREGVPTVPVYRSYLRAMLDMFPTLRNPRIGAQWLEAEQSTSADPGPALDEQDESLLVDDRQPAAAS